MKWCCSFVFLLVVGFLPFFALTKHSLNYEITQLTPITEYGKDWVDFNTMRIKKKSRNEFVISGEVIVKRNVGGAQKMVLQVSRYNPTLKQKGPAIYVKTFSFCEIYDELSTLYETLTKCSNIPTDKPCPLSKNTYSIKDFVIEDHFLPKNIPVGDYFLRGILNDDNVPVSGLTVMISVTKSIEQ